MIRISIKHLRKILDDLIEEHNPAKFGGCCQCTLCQESGQLCNELDEHREGFLVLEHGKEETALERFKRQKSEQDPAVFKAEYQNRPLKASDFLQEGSIQGGSSSDPLPYQEGYESQE